MKSSRDYFKRRVFIVFRKTLDRLILYFQRNNASIKTFLVLASILVGIASALAAVVLKTFVHSLHRIPVYFDSHSVTNFWLFILPVAGVILTIVITKIFFKGRMEKGLGSVLFAIARKSSRMGKEKMYSHLITSGVTVGLGGSAGLEAPIVITGSAIGSNIARILRFGYKERTLLLACGAASGIAAVFNSPIAGVVFALEVLLTEFTIPGFIPILISAASATIVSKLLFKGQLFYLVSHEWFVQAIPFYIILGILCGLVSVYMKRTTLAVESYFHDKGAVRKILGLLLLGGLIFLVPPLFGEGYDSVKGILNGGSGDLLYGSILSNFQDNTWLVLIFILGIIIIKPFATALTIGSGGNGGIFAPSLFTGAFTGFGMASLVNYTGITTLKTPNFIVVGMAGILSGVVHAPLTAIFLIAEITGGYTLFVPLMIVAALSYFITRFFEPFSVYTKALAGKGQLHTDDKDSNILRNLNIADLIETDFMILKTTDNLGQLVNAFAQSNRNIFPVVDENNEFYGVIILNKVKEYILKQELFDVVRIGELAEKPVTIDITESMDSVMDKFEHFNYWNFPVLDKREYIGFISQSGILSSYRRTLKEKTLLF